MHEKGLPHLLWKNKEDLKDEQKQQLEVILKEHPCLGIAWEMKEEIRQIYQSSRTFRSAERKLEKWIRIGGILYESSASMIQKHLQGICNYFENHTTNGLIKGMNTKIKLIKIIFIRVYSLTRKTFGLEIILWRGLMDGVIRNETFIETDIAAIFVNCLRSGAN